MEILKREELILRRDKLQALISLDEVLNTRGFYLAAKKLFELGFKIDEVVEIVHERLASLVNENEVLESD